MKTMLWGLAIALGAVPAVAAAQAAPAPAIGLGLPAIAAVLITGLIALVLKYTRI